MHHSCKMCDGNAQGCAVSEVNQGGYMSYWELLIVQMEVIF